MGAGDAALQVHHMNKSARSVPSCPHDLRAALHVCKGYGEPKIATDRPLPAHMQMEVVSEGDHVHELFILLAGSLELLAPSTTASGSYT